MNRTLPVIAGLFAVISTSSALASGAHSKGEDNGDPELFWGAGAEIDATDLGWLQNDNGTLINWDAYAWLGDDELKLRIESEGETQDGNTESSEVRALLSWNVAEFWDLQTGVRIDSEPDDKVWAMVGVQGLAPYFFETDAHVFVSDDGDVAFRLKQAFELPLTQRLVLEPHAEANVYAQDIAEHGIGAGLADLEVGLQLRYEIDRKFAPYVDVIYERKFGETSLIAQDEGEDPEAFSVRLGIRFKL